MLSIMLKNYRRRVGGSRKSVARQCKIMSGTVKNYEERVTQPTLKNIEKICEGLGWGHSVQLQLMEWLANGGIYHTTENRKVLNDEAMSLIQKLEKQYGTISKTPDDNPELLRVREILGINTEDKR